VKLETRFYLFREHISPNRLWVLYPTPYAGLKAQEPATTVKLQSINIKHCQQISNNKDKILLKHNKNNLITGSVLTYVY